MPEADPSSDPADCPEPASKINPNPDLSPARSCHTGSDPGHSAPSEGLPLTEVGLSELLPREVAHPPTSAMSPTPVLT